MSGTAFFIFSTPGVVVAFLIGAIWIALRPRSAIVRIVVLFAAIGYVGASTYAVPAALAGILTKRYHKFSANDVPPGKVALVIFGAGNQVVAGWQDGLSIPNPIAAARVLEAVRVYRIAHPQWVISSGGRVSPHDRSEPSSTNMRTLLVRLGVPQDSIIVESKSRETHENAVESGALARSVHADSIILVTSSVHMERSMGAFRAAGWTPTPAIAPDPWFENDWSDWLLPTNHGLYYSGDLVHELLGIPYYRLRGWWQ